MIYDAIAMPYFIGKQLKTQNKNLNHPHISIDPIKIYDYSSYTACQIISL